MIKKKIEKKGHREKIVKKIFHNFRGKFLGRLMSKSREKLSETILLEKSFEEK